MTRSIGLGVTLLLATLASNCSGFQVLRFRDNARVGTTTRRTQTNGRTRGASAPAPSSSRGAQNVKGKALMAAGETIGWSGGIFLFIPTVWRFFRLRPCAYTCSVPKEYYCRHHLCRHLIVSVRDGDCCGRRTIYIYTCMFSTMNSDQLWNMFTESNIC